MEDLSREQRLDIVNCGLELGARQFASRLPIAIDPMTTVMSYRHRVAVDAARHKLSVSAAERP